MGGCDGGWAATALHDFAKEEIVLVPAESYPYKGTGPYMNHDHEPCAVPPGKALPWTKVVDHVAIAIDEVKIAAALVQYGPLSASLDALAMAHYKSGVQDPWFFQCNGANLNHAVVIVGFGVDGKNYWRIQNSSG